MNSEDETNCPQLYLRILESDKLDFEQKKAMFNEIRKLMPPSENRWTLRWIIFLLAAVVISVPLYAFFGPPPPEGQGRVPEALLSLGSTALGALATFLTHYTRKANEIVSPTRVPSTSPAPVAVRGDTNV